MENYGFGVTRFGLGVIELVWPIIEQFIESIT